MQGHVRGDVGQMLHQEVGRAHPRLDGPERVFDRLTPDAHQVGVCIEPALDVLDQMLMNPSAFTWSRSSALW